MIDKETLNKVCPVPEESAVMNEIKRNWMNRDSSLTISIRGVFSISLSEYLS